MPPPGGTVIPDFVRPCRLTAGTCLLRFRKQRIR